MALNVQGITDAANASYAAQTKKINETPGLDPGQKALMLLQAEQQRDQLIAQTMSQMMKNENDTADAIARNI